MSIRPDRWAIIKGPILRHAMVCALVYFLLFPGLMALLSVPTRGRLEVGWKLLRQFGFIYFPIAILCIIVVYRQITGLHAEGELESGEVVRTT